MPSEFVPFNRPPLPGDGISYARNAFENHHVSGAGPYSRQCETFFERQLGTRKALLTTSCTDALEMCALLLNIQSGDEVIVPSFTFVSTANAFALRGARLIFCDIRADTLNLDDSKLEALITDRTKAIVPVHYAGVACEMDKIVEIASRYNIPVIEDNAHGLFGKYKGRWLGTLGSLATQSFHETKNISCGEGGALLINDPQYVERAEIMREKGTNRARYFRGQVDKYSWMDLGSSFAISDILAAFLHAQLEVADHIQTNRREIWLRYHSSLSAWALQSGISQPQVPKECEQSWHMYYLLMPSESARAALIDHLKLNNIQAVFHYLPLHLSDYAKRWNGKLGDCPVTEDITGRLIRLPFFHSMNEAQQTRVISTIEEFTPASSTS